MAYVPQMVKAAIVNAHETWAFHKQRCHNGASGAQVFDHMKQKERGVVINSQVNPSLVPQLLQLYMLREEAAAGSRKG